MKKKLSMLETAVALAAFTVLPAAFASCNDDDGGGVGSSATSALTVSVAEGDTAVPLAEGATAGIFAINDTSGVEALATVTALQGGRLDGADSIMAAMQDGVSLCAFSPSGLWTAETYGRQVQFSVQADQGTEAAGTASDLMMSPLTAVSGGRAALVMNHVMAKVTVHLTDVTGNYDLTTLSMTLPSRLTTVNADIAQGTAATVEGITADITPYQPDNTPYRASGTAIVAPGTVGGGAELVRVVIDGETFDYRLSGDTEWQAGKEYVYSMRLTEEGLVPYGSYVTDWGEGGTDLTGDAEEVFVYGVGDYLLSDGTFVKADRITASEAGSVVGVVFSSEVSAADAAAGYNAYVMGVERVTGKTFGFTGLVNESVTDYTVALTDLDGRTKTAQLMASDGYQAVEDKEGTVFGSLAGYSESHPLPSDVASGWFVPAFGQMMQMLNNVGQAGLTAETEVTESNNNPIYQSADADVFNRVNAAIEALGLEPVLLIDGSTVYVTSTEYNTETHDNFWCLQTLTSNGAWNWAFGHNPQRGSSSGRSLIPCAAVTLPAAL